VWQTSWIGCMISMIMHVNIWKWSVTWWRPAMMTMWLILWDSREEPKPGCIIWPGQEGSHLSPDILGRAIQGDHLDQWCYLQDIVTS
jgi:hypothetical protein